MSEENEFDRLEAVARKYESQASDKDRKKLKLRDGSVGVFDSKTGLVTDQDGELTRDPPYQPRTIDDAIREPSDSKQIEVTEGYQGDSDTYPADIEHEKSERLKAQKELELILSTEEGRRMFRQF